MGKKDIRTIPVPRRATVLLLVLISLIMIAFIAFLSGRAYYREPVTPARIVASIISYDRTGAARANVLASFATVIANALFFIPFGVLAFLSLDSANRRRSITYALVACVGVTFALCLNVWQQFLPTRITGWIDMIWNTAGALVGAVAGHLRKSVRVRFE